MTTRTVDVDALWALLSTQAYWARWRQRSDVEVQLRSAWRVVAAYDACGMVGFARAISDGVALAYLADVYVEERARGDGVGVELISTMIDGGPGAHMRWMLHTRDAHGLYGRFGFGRPTARTSNGPVSSGRRVGDACLDSEREPRKDLLDLPVPQAPLVLALHERGGHVDPCGGEGLDELHVGESSSRSSGPQPTHSAGSLAGSA